MRQRKRSPNAVIAAAVFKLVDRQLSAASFTVLITGSLNGDGLAVVGITFNNGVFKLDNVADGVGAGYGLCQLKVYSSAKWIATS